MIHWLAPYLFAEVNAMKAAALTISCGAARAAKATPDAHVFS